METLAFPPIPQERIKAFQAGIQNLQDQMQQFADGVLIGLGVDVLNSDIAVDLRTMTATITPKKGEAQTSPEEVE